MIKGIMLYRKPEKRFIRCIMHQDMPTALQYCGWEILSFIRFLILFSPTFLEATEENLPPPQGTWASQASAKLLRQ